MRASLVLHPAFLIALAVLLINDHALKALTPGPITGKLSDVAGLVVAPVLLIGSYEFAASKTTSARCALVVSILVGCGFTAIQVLPGAAEAYRVSMGAIQGLALRSPGVERAFHVADPWDLLALPAVLVTPLLVRRRTRLKPGSSPATPRTRTSSPETT
ncbi:MAG: hypothetical protein ACLFWM_08205 [Actinomycetota bacterium]